MLTSPAVRPDNAAMRRLLIVLFLLVAATCARAAEPITVYNVVLLQPSSVLEERVPNIDDMAAYIRSVQAASRDALLASPARQSSGGFIVVAVRPGPQSKVWLDFDALLDLEIRQLITTSVQAVKPFAAVKGPVVFALRVGLWGGNQPKRPMPAPAPWKKRAQGGPLEIDQLVEGTWDE
jgi:hypothetical protein